MNRKFALTAVLVIAGLTMILAPGCTGRGDSEEDEDLSPFLYQESFEIWPSPADLYKDVTFLFGWKDHDGDMENPTLLVRLVNEAGDAAFLDAENIEVDTDSDTAGSISFTIRILDGYQGDYYVVVQDEAGNLSNEITRFLYVNTEPPEDEDDYENG